MCKKLTYLISFVLVLSLTNSLLADWTGAVSSDWYDAANWTGSVPTSSDQTLIESSTPLTWPIIDGGTADTGQLRIGYGEGEFGQLTVTGGAILNVNDELRIARVSWSVNQPEGILYISGDATTVNVTERIALGRHGDGTIDMSGGYLHSDQELRLAYRDDAFSQVYLSGGTIDLAANPGITIGNDSTPGFALIDISGDGTLTLAGNQVSLIETLVSDGIILAGGGEGTVSVTYEGLTTTVVATGLVEETASNPYPAEGQTDVPQDAVLGWTPGEYAPSVNGHKVYFSESFNDVNEGIGGVTQDANSYTPSQLLDFGTTYYWRVDEVNGPPDFTVHPGDVWQFTIEPFSFPIEDVNATASSSNNAEEGPENTINDSGLDDNDLHSDDSKAMWLSSVIGPQPTWIQYELDRVYKLHQMLVWNHNTSTELVIGFGIKEAIIKYSTDGANWATLGTTHEFARAPGTAGLPPNTTVDLGSAVAKYVKITANSNWGGFVPQFGLSEVRFLYIPVLARRPNPDSGATDIDVDNVTLSWRAGREAASHEVYFSDSNQAVIDGTALVATVSEASYDTGELQLAQNYYWKVNEVNEAGTPTTWQGDVSNFTTREFLVVEDFEDYNDFEPDRIFDTWIDGWADPTKGGSQVGYAVSPFAEQTIVHSGKQSMPLIYDNSTANHSEATANVANLPVSQDWTKHGIKTLSLYFYGDPCNVAQQMYVKLNGVKMLYDGDAENTTRIPWQQWNINLADFTGVNPAPVAGVGVNLSNVTELIIGLERSGLVGGKGVVYFDDISLYPFSRELITPAEPDTASLVAHYEFEGTTNDSSGNGLHGTAVGDPFFVAGKVGQAISLDGIGDYVEITGYKGILGPSTVTVTAWIRTTATETGTIVGWGPNVDGQRFGFRIDEGRLRMEHDAGNLQGDSNVNDGGWHHVAVTVQANATISYPEVILWLNGIDDTRPTTDTDAFNLTADQDVSIGRRPANDTRYFMGQIDGVRIYDRALSQEEIAWLAGRTKPFDKPF